MKCTAVKRVETGTIVSYPPQRNTTLGPVAGSLLAILSNPPPPFLPSPRCYPLRSISSPTATRQVNQSAGSYGAIQSEHTISTCRPRLWRQWPR